MATYYVDGVAGNDANAGTSEGAGNAWATIDKACNTVSAGDHVYIKGNGDYTEIATIDTAGGSTTSIVYEGYTSTPGDRGMATIDATGLANGIAKSLGTANIYHAFKNITVENATSHGWSLDNASFISFENCQGNNNGGDGIIVENYSTFVDCVASDNSSDGFFANNDCRYFACVANDNGGYGIYSPGYSTSTDFCTAASNASGGIYLRRGMMVINCTIDGDGSGYGILCHGYADFGMVIANNIIYDCATGIRGDSTPCNGMVMGRNNLLYSNTTDYQDWPTEAQEFDITGDPLFTDEANRDYTLTLSSPARNAAHGGNQGASPGLDIGAHQSADDRIIITG